MLEQYIWLIWSLILVTIWAVFYFSFKNKESQQEMWLVSLWTSLLGLTEPLFVPRYWNPLSLFDLARKTGFDIESFIFSFAIGGIAVVIYEKFFPVTHKQIPLAEKQLSRHRYHLPILLSAPIIFASLLLFTSLNPIYSSFIALGGGGLLTWYCRSDLKKKMIASAFIFFGLYFLYFFTLILMAPDYVVRVWNLAAISGVLILGIPLEELIFAFSFGFFWSSIYEHFTWRKLIKNKNESQP